MARTATEVSVRWHALSAAASRPGEHDDAIDSFKAALSALRKGGGAAGLPATLHGEPGKVWRNEPGRYPRRAGADKNHSRAARPCSM